MRIVYALTWSRLRRDAMRDQSVNTAASLARKGASVTLLMPQRSRDEPITAADLRAYYGVEGDFEVVQRSSPWIGPRVLGSAMWLRRVFRDPILRDADLLYSRAPEMLGIGHLSPIPFAFEHYRLWPDELPWLKPFFRRSMTDPMCVGLVLHSEHAAGAYRRAGIGTERILVAHNGSEAVRLGKPLDKAAARATLGLPPERPIALYAGRVGPDKGLAQIGELARRRPEVLFLLVGDDGSRKAAKAAPKGENIRLVPWQTHKSLGPWLWAADVLLVPASRAPLEQFGNCVLPMKLFTYLAAGRPILAPDAPDTREVLVHEENALLVEPDRPDDAAAALDRLLGDADLAETLSTNALRLSGEVSWDSRAERLLAFLRQRCAQLAPVAGTGAEYAGGAPAFSASRASSSNI